MEKLSQGNRMALGCSAPITIRFVDLAIAGEGLEWHAVPCRPWLSPQAKGSTLGQDSDVVGKQWNAQILVYLPVTYQGAPVPRRRHLDCNTYNFRTW